MPSDPLILAFDTSAAHCAAALLCGERVVAAAQEDMAKGQAERLMPLIQEVLATAGVTTAELDAIGVGTGPGNFTGIRISVSAARGLALALERPAIGVTRFEAMTEGLDQPIMATLDARRGMVYASCPGTAPFGPVLPEDMASTCNGTGWDVVGHEAEAFAALTGGRARLPAYPVAEAIARCALRGMGAQHPRPAPLYIRGADAAPPSDPPPVVLS